MLELRNGFCFEARQKRILIEDQYLSKDDLVLIIMGSAHTAFFRDFLSRSPKYEMVNNFDYLK